MYLITNTSYKNNMNNQYVNKKRILMKSICGVTLVCGIFTGCGQKGEDTTESKTLVETIKKM